MATQARAAAEAAVAAAQAAQAAKGGLPSQASLFQAAGAGQYAAVGFDYGGGGEAGDEEGGEDEAGAESESDEEEEDGARATAGVCGRGAVGRPWWVGGWLGGWVGRLGVVQWWMGTAGCA